MRRFAWLLIVVVTMLGGHATAQSRPDFSGVWVSEGSTIGIRQDGATLAITNATGTETRTYNMDGSESRFETTGRSGVSQLTAHVRWTGSALVISTTTVSPIGTWTDLDVYSLDYGPKLSVVRVVTQTTRPMMSTTVTTYRKN